jgi:hypothetical protein
VVNTQGATLPRVAEWLCVDIETTAGRPESADRYMRDQWSPNHEWTPDTIGKRYKEAREKWLKKLALLDAAGIAVVALNSPIGRIIFHTLEEQAWTAADFANVCGYKTEREMLIALREWLEMWCCPKTLFVGHNIRSFDLPRLRLAYLRAELQIPGPLGLHQPHFDCMREFCRAFSVERSEMVALSEVLEKLGLQNHKGVVDGSQIDALIAKREFEAILRYAGLDVMAESEVFLRLTGRSAQLK